MAAQQARANAAPRAIAAQQGACVRLEKGLDGPYRTSDNKFLTDRTIPVGVNFVLNGRLENLFYFPVTLTVINCGSTALSNIVVKDSFGKEVQPFEYSDPGNVETIWEVFDAGNVLTREYITWRVGTLAAGESRTLTIKVGTEVNNSLKLEPGTFGKTLLYNGLPSATTSASVTTAEGPGASVGTMPVSIGPKVTCVNTIGEWNKLISRIQPRVAHDGCAVVTTALPLKLTSP